jgi:uncharacterized protein YhjY with autotransporter beta-barrel domain
MSGNSIDQRNSVNCGMSRYAAYALVITASGVAIAGLLIPASQADTFSNVMGQQLQGECDISGNNDNGPVVGPNTPIPGSNLASLCNQLQSLGVPTGATGNSGIASTAAPVAVERRLRLADRSRDAGTGGASADVMGEIAPGLSIYISPGYQRISHRNNSYEDGYSSNGAIVTAGADYQFTDFLIAGAALNYTYDNGNFDDGGGFDNQGYGAFLYTSVIPFEGSFAQLVGGYRRRNYDESRNGGVIVGVPGGGGSTVVGEGNINGDYTGNEWSAGLLTGYDYPIDNFTIGPRAGLDVVYNTFDDYSESGSTGLELNYDSDETTSIQTNLGAVATMAISTGFGVVVPQVFASWVHEFDNDQRNIGAGFRDATDSNFKFESEKPDRDYARLGAGVATILPNGLQPYAGVSTIAGNSRFWTLTAAVGVRMDL